MRPDNWFDAKDRIKELHEEALVSLLATVPVDTLKLRDLIQEMAEIIDYLLDLHAE